MQLNTDLTRRVVVDSTALPWQPSPMQGVHRRLLARDGDEDAEATSVVRYEPGAHFERHVHPRGEEFLVLSGVFEDEQGSYPAGTYVKNPPGSAHAPSSAEGCTLFVKLRHLHDGDRRRVVVRPSDQTWHPGLVEGLAIVSLDEYRTSSTALVRWAPNTRFNPHLHPGGEEIFVVDGVFEDEHGTYRAGTWLRTPPMSAHQPFSREGCLILVKVGHLMRETFERGLSR
jgi:anti-sigma factor ChrR (cupin superfamily)